MFRFFSFKKIVAALASPSLLFFVLPWLMLILFLGTLAQRYIGLVEAQRIFFSSWIFWIGPIPTAGGITTLAILTLNLLMRLLFFSPWQKEKAGTICTHIGVLMLLMGGAISWHTQQEGYITLLEGESASAMQDYYERELTISKNGTIIHSWPEKLLLEQTALKHSSIPFFLKISEFCSNCDTFLQENPAKKHGIAQKLILKDALPAKEKEDNKAGVAFELKGASKEQDGGYIAYELLPSQSPEILVGGNRYRIALSRMVRPLPFTVTLQDFRKIRYPGSDQAQEYRSLVAIKDDNTHQERQTTIAMNEPLRLKGYAIYQSSFLKLGEKEASVLAVVKNDAWLMPYLATFILTVGLLWHLAWRLSLPKKYNV